MFYLAALVCLVFSVLLLWLILGVLDATLFTITDKKMTLFRS